MTQEAELDTLFEALADRNRRKVVEALKSGPKTIGALQKPLGVTTWGVMKHVRVLEESGLVTSVKRGRSRYCELHPEKLQIATGWMDDVCRFWAANLELLAEHLDDQI